MNFAAVIGGAFAAAAVYLLVKSDQPKTVELTVMDFMSLQNPDGSMTLDPGFKPAINSDQAAFGFAGLSGHQQLGDWTDFDFGAWAYETEPWGVQDIRSDILIAEEDIELMNADELIMAVADHLKGEEGFRGFIYDDVNGKPWSASKLGNPTTGYGHLVTAQDVAAHGWNWTLDEFEAYSLLLQDVNKHLAPIIPAVTVPLTLPQWVAIASLAFNAGPHGVKKSKFIKAVNAQNIPQAEIEFKDWNKATFVVDGQRVKREVKGLTNRRNREWALFMQPAQVVLLNDGGSFA